MLQINMGLLGQIAVLKPVVKAGKSINNKAKQRFNLYGFPRRHIKNFRKMWSVMYAG